MTAIRVICPPTCSPESTRVEVRVGGADINVYLAVSAILACGMYGITEKLELQKEGLDGSKRLPMSLDESLEEMQKMGSLARKVLGDNFCEHDICTRKHELRKWKRAVTDWELKRYMETV